MLKLIMNRLFVLASIIHFNAFIQEYFKPSYMSSDFFKVCIGFFMFLAFVGLIFTTAIEIIEYCNKAKIDLGM